ncbi:MAG: regulator of sigma E protease [Saprospiraceae bacterium]|jgi:regulator of sigma E protease
MEYLIMAGQLIMSLSILIVLHEMGHFFPARWFNTRVEKFYLFFDPGFSLFKYKRGDTEYGIGWLPLGGYVKISGMIDESMDKEQLALPAQPWEFRSKPAWQRLIIMLGGVTVNFILGFLLFGMVLFTWGKKYLPAENAIYGIHADSLGRALGLETGDKILAIGDKPFDRFSDSSIKREIVINQAKTLKVNRNGEEISLPISQDDVNMLTKRENKEERLFLPRLPFVVNNVPAKGDYPARKAGIEVNDSIVGVNGQRISYYDQYVDIAKNNKGKEISLSIVRAGKEVEKMITLTKDGLIGVQIMPPEYFFKISREEYSFAQSFPAGFNEGYNLLADQIKAFGGIFAGRIKASESLGGFGTIAGLFGGQWVWENFWRMTAVLSLILAFMNLLPIPALDGGYVMFLMYELVSGRKPSDKFLEYATITGFVLVLGLLLYANGLELIAWLQDIF